MNTVCARQRHNKPSNIGCPRRNISSNVWTPTKFRSHFPLFCLFPVTILLYRNNNIEIVQKIVWNNIFFETRFILCHYLSRDLPTVWDYCNWRAFNFPPEANEEGDNLVFLHFLQPTSFLCSSSKKPKTKIKAFPTINHNYIFIFFWDNTINIWSRERLPGTCT